MELESNFREPSLWTKQHWTSLSLPDITTKGEAVNRVAAS